MDSVNRMVKVRGKTYRFSRREDGVYEVYRILDDKRVGTFARGPHLQVVPESGHESVHLLREIALAALQQGRLSWTGRLRVA